MADSDTLTQQILKMTEGVESGEIDPIDLELASSYQELREIIAELEKRVGLDEALNEILATKVGRVQEIARILQAPEFYLRKLKKLKTRDIAKLISYKRPISVTQLEVATLQRALERMILFKEQLTREIPEDEPPSISNIPSDYRFESEDAVFMKDLEEFLASIKRGKEFPIDELIAHHDFDIFLKRFLYIVILISRGDLLFNRNQRTVVRED